MSSRSVGVIFGGRSVEHDVSIVSAHQAMAVLAPDYEVVPIYITREGGWLTGPGLNDLDVHKTGRAADVGEEAFIPPVAGYGGLYAPGSRWKGPRRIPLDVVLPAVHGTFGEDGTLQGLLEMADIPYAGAGVVGASVGMDKIAMKAVFKEAGLPVVPYTPIEASRLAADLDGAIGHIAGTIGYPAFVKPARAGSSVGIAKARDEAGLREALDVARRYDRRLIVEQAMEDCIEVNCSVLGGGSREPRPSVCEQPVPWEEFLSFSDKYLRGGKEADGSKAEGMASLDRRIPAPIPDGLTAQVQANAVTAFGAVDAAGVARIDSFVQESTGQTWVMEINTTPGSFSFYLWEPSGVPFNELLHSVLDVAAEVHDAKSGLMYSFDSKMLAGTAGVKAGG